MKYCRDCDEVESTQPCEGCDQVICITCDRSCNGEGLNDDTLHEDRITDLG